MSGRLALPWGGAECRVELVAPGEEHADDAHAVEGQFGIKHARSVPHRRQKRK